jgi:hypothetical protein
VARELGQGRMVVVLLPDTAERYLSGDLFGIEGKGKKERKDDGKGKNRKCRR